MYDQEIPASKVKVDRFPFPSEGDITLAVRNKDYALGPVMLHIVMKPGSVIPAHLHKGVSEALYVVEGEFINEGKNIYPERRFTSRPASRMVRTAPRKAARYFCSGRIKPRHRKPTSMIS